MEQIKRLLMEKNELGLHICVRCIEFKKLKKKIATGSS